MSNSPPFDNEQLAQAHSELLIPGSANKHAAGRLSARVLALCLASAVAGAGLAVVIMNSRQNTERWVDVTQDKNFVATIRSGVVFDPEILNLALSGQSVMTPTLTPFEARARFVWSNTGQYRLGYIVNTKVAAIPPGAFPPQFSDAAVSYRLTFRFTLRDKDGFPLETLQSPETKVSTGQDVKLQNVATKEVPEALISKVRKIDIGIRVSKVDVINCCSEGKE